jgi:hypothetical protein
VSESDAETQVEEKTESSIGNNAMPLESSTDKNSKD